MSEEVIERVPPPPPPGFGDEEYYRLYGRPEEYHKYRQKLAQKVRGVPKPSRVVLDHTSGSPGILKESRRVVKGPPFNSYEEEYEHYYGRKNKASSSSGKGAHSEEEEDEEGTPELSSSSQSSSDDNNEVHEISVEELSDGSEGEVFDEEESFQNRERNYGKKKRGFPPPRKRRVPQEDYRVARIIRKDSEDEGTPSLSEEEEGGDLGRRMSSPMRSHRRSIKDRLGHRSSPRRRRPSPTRVPSSSSKRPRREPPPPRREPPLRRRRNGRRSPPKKQQQLTTTSSSSRRSHSDRRRPPRRSPPLRGMESETHRRGERLLTRSPEERRPRRRQEAGGKEWVHDKFRELSGSPIDVEEDIKRLEGQHWKQIRSERSKERERNGGSPGRRRRRRGRRRSSSNSSRSSSSRSRSSRSYSRSSSSRSRSSYSSSSSRSSLDSYLRSRRRPRQRQRSSSPSRQNMNNNHSSNNGANGKSNLPSEDVLVDESEQPFPAPATDNETLLKLAQPPDARRPRTKWRLYVFKGNEELPILYIHRQPSYLLGRDRKVADVPLDHPSCSKQHAVLQYRLITYRRSDGSRGKRVRPYIIDLNSANGTFINNKKIEPQKFLQVLEKDVLKFGFSSREYVLLHDQTNDAENEDMGLDS
eukprot:TRINITY_DN2277_c0_g1_i2.p1 TRINITY_DN2277_c0_g1~~TRINITY_DN2277_c0_g1_i2.p1  ORF type:complete len:642 (+),score=212.45 TRINITY_DN2277_c0_g1_i2:49-1974(+)